MKRFLLLVVALITCVICATNAHAKFYFGPDEHINFVAFVTFLGPQGERLYLGRKVTMDSFFAPYSIKDDGFVLGISGESKTYYAMPNETKIKELQAAGYLPNPLPEWEFSKLDLIVGYSLWLLLAGLLGYFGIKALLKKWRNSRLAD